MILRNLILILTFSSCIALAAESPLKFSEEVEFLSKKEKPLLDMNKTDDFVGILTRTNTQQSDQRILDLYLFADSKISKIDEKNCQDLATRVFGSPDKISLKITGKETFRSPRKEIVCEMVFQDPDKEALFKERRLFVFISNDKVYGIVSRFSQPAKSEQANALKDFIKGLR